MSITTESSFTTTRTNIEQQVNGPNKILVTILTVILPTIAFIVIITTIVIIYRRRHSTVWLKKLENSSRLQAIVVRLPTPTVRPRYSAKKSGLLHGQFQKPCTKTIVYNRMSVPTIPVANDSLKLSIEGEINTAFDQCSLRMTDQSTTTWQSEFPVSLQAPVPSITATFVEAIASHRLTLLGNTTTTSLETSPSITNNDRTRYSGMSSTPHSNPSQRILLFSQRTEF